MGHLASEQDRQEIVDNNAKVRLFGRDSMLIFYGLQCLPMNENVLEHVIKHIKHEMYYCARGILIHKGGKESALETYEKVINTLSKMQAKK